MAFVGSGLQGGIRWLIDLAPIQRSGPKHGAADVMAHAQQTADQPRAARLSNQMEAVQSIAGLDGIKRRIDRLKLEIRFANTMKTR